MVVRTDPPRLPVVVKLGGSLLTRKGEVEKLRPKVISRLADEIVGCSDVPMVLLHGAGSFGHPGALRFGLARPPEGGATSPPRRRAAAIVSAEVRRLHLAVLRELVRAGAAPWSVPPADHARNREGRLVAFDVRPIEEALRRGNLPVAFGDVVPDEVWGFSILSADTIASALVPTLHPVRVVFASDVPGILPRPGAPSRTVIGEVNDELVHRLQPTGGGPDVTGGIRAKAEAMLAIARGGADAALISGLTDGAVSRAIRGEAVYGSWAHASAP